MTITAKPLTTIALLAVMKMKGFGRRKALEIVSDAADGNKFSDYCESLVRLASQLNGKYPPESELRKEFKKAWDSSEKQLEKSREAGIQAVSIYDARYPRRLKNIHDPPAVLFIKGNADALEAENSLAVVGTREPTSYGEDVAQKYARAAAEAGFVVISGLANGCDVIAHEGCLDGGGIGVVVLAHGLDRIYPASNRDLAERLLKHKGCFVSEYPIFVKPSRLTFAERDRLQSGLSDGVLVIETDVEGGTKHTVGYALKQKRPIACIEHPSRLLKAPKAQGNQEYIKSGSADPISDEDTLIQYLNEIKSNPANKSEEAPGGSFQKIQKQESLL